jgi:oxygen tolerance protein BatD
MRRVLVVIALLAALASPAAAADPVNAAAQIDRTSINVGDRIALSIVVNADAGYIVSDPTIAREIGSFEVVQTQDVKKSVQGSQVRYTYRYQITAWTIGDLVLPSISVPYIGPNGTTGTAQTQEAAIKVTSVVLPGEDTADIKPLKPQLDLVEPPWALISRLAIGVAAAIGVALFAAAILWLLLRKRGALFVEERLTPVQRALRELDALAELHLPEQGKVAEHYERLCASLRRYAVERFGVQPGRTSREIRVALERAGLERTQAGAIYEILREGDEVRFRHATPYPAHAQNAVRAALEIVRRAASAEEYETAALQPQ